MKTEASKGRDTFDGYLVSDLEAAFNLIKDPIDWKRPIDAFVPDGFQELVDVAIVAIRFYTATDPTVVKGTGKNPDTGEPVEGVFITAAGYRGGPAGDH